MTFGRLVDFYGISAPTPQNVILRPVQKGFHLILHKDGQNCTQFVTIYIVIRASNIGCLDFVKTGCRFNRKAVKIFE